jgi:hypothetical protein
METTPNSLQSLNAKLASMSDQELQETAAKALHNISGASMLGTLVLDQMKARGRRLSSPLEGFRLLMASLAMGHQNKTIALPPDSLNMSVHLAEVAGETITSVQPQKSTISVIKPEPTIEPVIEKSGNVVTVDFRRKR